MVEIIYIDTDKISLEYRHDILLREYVIRNDDNMTWNKFLSNQIKYSLPQSNSYDNFINLKEDIFKNGIKNHLEGFYHDDKIMVSDGAHRLAIAKALDIVKIPMVLDNLRRTLIPVYLISKKHLEDSELLFKDYYLESHKIQSVFEGIDKNIFSDW